MLVGVDVIGHSTDHAQIPAVSIVVMAPTDGGLPELHVVNGQEHSLRRQGVAAQPPRRVLRLLARCLGDPVAVAEVSHADTQVGRASLLHDRHRLEANLVGLLQHSSLLSQASLC
jgi:hypothetical protein